MPDKNLKKILLVDDDPDIREFMSYNLKKNNYKVYTAPNGLDALDIVERKHPDLVILDIMMPEMNGIQVCKKIRSENKYKNILICFLTAKGEEYSQIAGFDAGADDYVTKPVKPNIFIKKIDALLRRSEKEISEDDIFYNGKLEINYITHVVKYDGKEIILAKKEFALLKLFASSPGKVFQRDEIYSSIWGNNIVVGDRTIDVHISKLREKIGDEYIITLKGVGYKFNLI